jgi:hypothetical protein
MDARPQVLSASPDLAVAAMELRFMSAEELVTLFHQLPAPDFAEMHGELVASFVKQH